MQALIALAGEVHDSPLVRNALHRADLIVAADSGASRLRKLGFTPHVVIGDLDSLPGDDLFGLRAAGVEFEPHPAPQQRTDGDVAIDYALQRGATSIIVLGLLGGPRLDHAVGNLDLLTSPRLRHTPTWTVDGWSTLTVLHADGVRECHFHGHPGDYVSIIPISDTIQGVQTIGLKWALQHATLQRGQAAAISNELLSDRAIVRITSGTAVVGHHFLTEQLP